MEEPTITSRVVLQVVLHVSGDDPDAGEDAKDRVEGLLDGYEQDHEDEFEVHTVTVMDVEGFET
jgi:hypothetical protein